MAQVTHNKFTEGLSGKFGNLVFRHMKDGRTIVCHAPDFSNRKFSKGQRAHQTRFQEAVAYARQAARANPIYAKLAEGTSKNAYNFALSDWFHPPVIHEVTRRDGHIHVKASDNVQVTKVLVTITDEAGQTLEQGSARSSHGDNWEYVTATEGNITIEAFDLPGNCTRQEA